MRTALTLLLTLLMIGTAYAGSMKVVTGFGVIKDSNGNIHSKYILPPGDHPLKEGFTYEELEDMAALDVVVIYEAPKTQDELDEELIQQKMGEVTRKMAVDEIRKTNFNFKDPRTRGGR